MIGRYLGYVLVGGIGTATSVAFTITSVEILALHPVAGSAVGFLVALVVQYLLNNAFVFRGGSPRWGRFFRYAFVSMTGLGLNLGIMYGVVETLQWHYLYGILISIFIVTPTNFLLNQRWSFRNRVGPES